LAIGKTHVALAGLVIAGVATAGLFVGGNLIFASPEPAADIATATAQFPAANRDVKTDRLPVIRTALAPDPSPADAAALSVDGNIAASDEAAVAPIKAPPLPMPRPPQRQTSYTLLSEVQIGALKQRLKLTAAQEPYWPPVETALRNLARRLHETRVGHSKGNAQRSSPPIDANSVELAQLKEAAAPLVARLQADQKRDLRMLAHIVGLEAVASQI
jgi:hypothetical protein